MEVGVVALSGTKIALEAALYTNRTYESILLEVETILEEAAAQDAEEERRFGPERRGDELPEAMQDRGGRLERLKRCRERLDGEVVVEPKLLKETIEAIVLERPDPSEGELHLCPDKGYENSKGRGAVEGEAYVSHIRTIAVEAEACDRSKGHKPLRWVGERAFARLSKYRGIPVRYDKKDGNSLGLIRLACGLAWNRRFYRMGRCDVMQDITWELHNCQNTFLGSNRPSRSPEIQKS